ncbi:MAG: RHS repeat-associated core domain-containing protein, partial [Cupriavidus sp.]
YYRYHVDPIGGQQRHLLKTVVGPTMYMLLKQAGQDVLTMLQSSGGPDLVPEFANNTFEYDAFNRVIREVARGNPEDSGPEGWTFTRSVNPALPRNQRTPSDAAGYNTWYWKIVEEGRAGLRRIFYTNKIGQILAEVSEDTDDPARQWIEAWHRDGNGNILLHALPSAVAGIDESLLDLIGAKPDGTFAGLRSLSGLIQRSDYYTATTATSSQEGGVAGYLKTNYVQQGFQGELIPQDETTYIASSSGPGPIAYAVSSETKFKFEEDTPASRITTRYEYVWTSGIGGLPRIAQKTTILPEVPTGEGGDGASAVRRVYFDGFANPTWELDERGILTSRLYDNARKLLLQEIRDSGDAGNTPGWPVLPGAHFEQTFDYSYDELGRETRQLGPEHEAVVEGAAVLIRTARYSIHVDAPLSGQSLFGPIVLDTVRTAGGYRLSGDGSEHLIDPVSIECFDKCGRKVQEIASARSTGSGPLSASDTFLRADWSRWKTYFFNERGLPAGERIYHRIPAANSGLEGVWENLGLPGTNYSELKTVYETTRTLVALEISADGTWASHDYDALGRLVSTWIGTEEENLTLVLSKEYDDGLAGRDSNVTSEVRWLTDTMGRTTRYGYDYRDRRIWKAGEEESFFEFSYDNLGRLVAERRLILDAHGKLLAFGENLFNGRDQLYEIRRHAVDPATGTVGPSSLVGTRRYDPVGNLIESTQPGEGRKTEWLAFDNLNRSTSQSIGYWNEDSPSAAIVVEKSEFTYDLAGNLLQRADGKLDAGSGAPNLTYRTSYVQVWSDALGRSLAEANHGALPTAPVRPSVPPGSSDVVLVSQVRYNRRGETIATIDPIGRENRFAFDDKGRLSQTIENFVAPGLPEGDTGANRTMRYAYTPGDQVARLETLFPEGQTSQTTTFEYGVVLGPSDIASNGLIFRKLYPDGSAETYGYNRQGERMTYLDAVGTSHQYDYDRLGRLRHDRVLALGEGVAGSVRRISCFYNDLGLVETVVSASSADVSQGAEVNEIRREYDAYGDLIREYQEHAGKVVVPSALPGSRFARWTRNAGAGNSNRVAKIAYPSGQEFALGYGASTGPSDALGLVRIVAELDGSVPSELIAYDYLGASLPVRTAYIEPGVTLDLWGGGASTYQGLDRFNRVIDQPWKVGSADLARLQYGYDSVDRRTYRRDTVAEWLTTAFDELYAYDGCDQLLGLQRGVLNVEGTELNPDTQSFFESITYDTIGNWTGYQSGDAMATLEQTRNYNAVNEIARIKTTLGSWWAKPAYDPAGNTTRLPKGDDAAQKIRVVYDAWKRPEWVYAYTANWERKKVVRYSYDGLGRRVCEFRYDPFSEHSEWGRFIERLDFYFDERWRGVETFTGEEASVQGPLVVGQVQERFVWGQASGQELDVLALRDRPITEERLYVLQDARANVVALSDDSGAVLERFAYSAFGQVSVLDPDFVPRAASEYQWNILFSGRPRDRYTGIDNVRSRDYAPVLGRWLTRDPIGEGGGINLYAYVSNNTPNFIDPSGLYKPPIPLEPGTPPKAPWTTGLPGAVATAILAAIDKVYAGCQDVNCLETCIGCCTSAFVGGATAGIAAGLAALPSTIAAGAINFAVFAYAQKVNYSLFNKCLDQCTSKESMFYPGCCKEW